jgi:hypothetical protein
MNGCPPNNGTECRVVQVIEPEGTVFVSTSAGSTDQSLDEMGSVALTQGQTNLTVPFQTPKAGENYRFEYLYIDAFGVTPGNVEPMPTIQTIYGFTVKFVGAAVLDGYVLRWRVVVIEFGIGGQLDAPEAIYTRLPQASIFTVHLVNPRSATDYAFDELHVENLVDDVELQTPVLVQIVEKTKTSFTIGINPTPPTDNYYLAARVPIT